MISSFLKNKRPDLVVDGLADTAAIYVDNAGNYYTNGAAVRVYKN
ncbi:MAG: hypothetical protein R3C49_01025 [Planctomycetaceae bacterium]